VQHTELAKFRRPCSRWHIGLKRAEMVVENYAFQLVQIEARTQGLAPDPLRFYKSNPVFTRNELRPLPIAILREAGEPLPTQVIAMRAMAAKGVVYPRPANVHQKSHQMLDSTH
jgi:hypothetical protein